MKRILLYVFISLLFVNCKAQVKGVEHVIIFGIDALSVDAIYSAKTPNLDYLMKNGSYSLHSRGVMPTVSAPNWSSILMGAGPEQHSITSNEWEPDNPPFPPASKSKDGFPTIFQILKEKNPSAKTTAIYDWDKFQVLISQKYLDKNLYVKTSLEVLTNGIEDFKENKPTLSFLYFGFVDETGHGHGHGTEQYYYSVFQADSMLGVLLGYLKETKLDESTIIFVVSDHGGVGFGHGGESLAEIEIPLFIYGAGVTKGKEITSPVNNFDVASTIAYVFNLEQPEEWIGRPIKSAFDKTGENSSTGIVKSPQIIPKGKLYFNESENITLQTYTENADLFYTLDGTEPTGNSNHYKAPFKVAKSSILKAKAIGKNGKESLTKTSYIRVVNQTIEEQGISYSYYEGNFLMLPDFSKLTSFKSGKVYELSIDSIKSKEDHFAVKFDGYINLPENGVYTFTVMSDDGSKLFINDSLLIDNDGSHSAQSKSEKIKLNSGKHKLEFHYFEDYGSEFLEVFIEGPGIPKQIITPDRLSLNK